MESSKVAERVELRDERKWQSNLVKYNICLQYWHLNSSVMCMEVGEPTRHPCKRRLRGSSEFTIKDVRVTSSYH